MSQWLLLKPRVILDALNAVAFSCSYSGSQKTPYRLSISPSISYKLINVYIVIQGNYESFGIHTLMYLITEKVTKWLTGRWCICQGCRCPGQGAGKGVVWRVMFWARQRMVGGLIPCSECMELETYTFLTSEKFRLIVSDYILPQVTNDEMRPQ